MAEHRFGRYVCFVCVSAMASFSPAQTLGGALRKGKKTKNQNAIQEQRFLSITTCTFVLLVFSKSSDCLVFKNCPQVICTCSNHGNTSASMCPAYSSTGDTNMPCLDVLWLAPSVRCRVNVCPSFASISRLQRRPKACTRSTE